MAPYQRQGSLPHLSTVSIRRAPSLLFLTLAFTFPTGCDDSKTTRRLPGWVGTALVLAATLGCIHAARVTWDVEGAWRDALAGAPDETWIVGMEAANEGVECSYAEPDPDLVRGGYSWG